ncbi:MAG: hypothetical protein FJ382_13655, partial [Verrucomicrobia bacterium]|nr:hypothetical protein [Verrucomicrobiota bacterium]
MKSSFARLSASALVFMMSVGALLAQSRTISAVVSGNAISGTGSAALVLASQGNEQGVGFSVTFDPAKLKYEGYSNGSGLGTANLQYNATQASSGRIGVAVAFSGSTTFATGNRELVVLNFSVLSGGSTTIDFGNVPVVKEVVDAAVNELAVTYVPATITAAVTATTPPAAPVINSASTASATVGTAFSYQIAASNSPTSYAATNLPGGLSVNTSTGLISGTPTTAGSANVSIVASNSGGNSPTFTLALTVNPRPLTVTLQGSVAKVYDGTDAAFVGATNYQISGLLPSDAITISKSSGKYNSAAAGGTLMDVEGVVRSWSMDGTKLGA